MSVTEIALLASTLENVAQAGGRALELRVSKPTKRTLTFPDDTIYQKKVAAWVRFTSYNAVTGFRRRADIMNGIAKSKLSIQLPLQGYQSPNTIDYQEQESGIMSQLMLGAGAGSGSEMGRLHNLGLSFFRGLLGISPNTAAGNAVGLAAGDVNYSDLQFKKAIKRMHSFKFNLFAKNKIHAQTLDDIGSYLQTYMYPEMESPSTNLLIPPDMWKIDIVPNGGAQNSRILHNDIGLCVLAYCEVNRLDITGPVLTQENYFSGIGLNCVFYEVESAYKADQRVGQPGITLKSRSQIRSILGVDEI